MNKEEAKRKAIEKFKYSITDLKEYLEKRLEEIKKNPERELKIGHIKWYKRDGEYSHQELLLDKYIEKCHGQMVKCYMANKEIKVGYADVFKCCKKDEYSNKVKDYIYLWTWKNLNEETHQLEGTEEEKYDTNLERINILDINDMDAILYSNHRWGGKLTNKFFIDGRRTKGMYQKRVPYEVDSWSIIERKVLNNNKYTAEEKITLAKMIRELEQKTFLLYGIEILQQKEFKEEIPEFDKYKAYLRAEVYDELIEQLLEKSKDYEDIFYADIQDWFEGLTIDIELLNRIDALFKANNIKINY